MMNEETKGLYRVARRDVKTGKRDHNEGALTLADALSAAQTGNALCQGHVEFWPEILNDADRILELEGLVGHIKALYAVSDDHYTNENGRCYDCDKPIPLFRGFTAADHEDNCVIREVLSLDV